MTGLRKACHQTADVSEILSYTMQLIDYMRFFNPEIKFCKDAWCQHGSTSDHALWPQPSFRHQQSLLSGTQDGVWSDKAKVAWRLMAGSHFSGALNGLGAFLNKEI